MNRGTASAAAVAVLLALIALPVAPVTAQTAGPAPDAAADAPARVTLTAIDPVIGRGSVAPDPATVDGASWSLLVEHTGTVAWERLEVVAELHGALGSRSALRAALAGGTVPPAAQRVVAPGPTGPIAPGSVMRIDGVVPLVGARLTGADSAVHPLRLRVLADGQPVGSISTAVVRLGAAPTARLAASLVWPLAGAPQRGPAGDPSAGLDPLTLAGGALDTLISALAPLVELLPPGDGRAWGEPRHFSAAGTQSSSA